MAIKLEDVDTRCIADDSLPWLPLAPYAELASVKLSRAAGNTASTSGSQGRAVS